MVESQTVAEARSQGDVLIALAEAAGCRLELVAFSVLLRGRFPVRYGSRKGAGRVPEVDRDQPRFPCRGCGARGGSYAFATRLWGMSVLEARQGLSVVGRRGW